jgi:hypothetical protein
VEAGSRWRRRAELVNRIRRHLEERCDQLVTLARWKLQARRPAAPEVAFDGPGQARFALLTVNRSTTRYLKLMLLTLCEQTRLDRIYRIIVCDNGSRDGGKEFLRRLAQACPRILLVELQRGTSHARGMRHAIAALRTAEAAVAPPRRANIWLFCDTDIVFRNPATLADLGDRMLAEGAAFAGELTQHMYPYPEAQASFVAVRADWYTRPEVVPWVNHGAPSYWMQRSIWRAKGRGLHFPSNHGGYILHRGRTAVASARTYDPLGSYATAPLVRPHFMGVTGGQAIWDEIEGRHAHLLEEAQGEALITHLCDRLNANGASV